MEGDTSYRIAKIKLHDVSVRGGVGTGFRVPGFDERNVRNTEGEPLDWMSEHSTTHEIGLRVGRDPWNFFDISIFNTDLEHQYVKEDYNQQGVILIPTMHDSTAEMQGIEIQSGFKVGRWDGKLSYTHTDTDSGENIRAHDTVKNQVSVSAGYAVTPWFNLGTQFTHRSQREEHRDRLEDGDSVNLWDLQGFYRVNETTLLGMAVKNVADKEYELHSLTEVPRRTLWVHC